MSPPQAHLAHAVPGRLQLRLVEPFAPEEMAALGDHVAALGAARVVGRPSNGRLIVETDDIPEAFAARLVADGLPTLVRPPRPAPFRQSAMLRLVLADAALQTRAEGALDLRGAVAIGLFGAAIFQAACGRLFGPAATMAGLALSLLDSDRR